MMGGRGGRRLGLYVLVTLALVALSYRLLPTGMSLSCPPVMVPKQVSLLLSLSLSSGGR